MKKLRLLIVLAIVGLGLPVSALAAQSAWTGVERVVAVGDVHGAYDELTDILRGAGMIDGEGRWSGGRAHLVSMGDLVDRGARSRDALELMMRLEEEAAAAGGRVHVLLANHEAMRVSGELQDTADGEFAAFAADEDPARREAAYRRFLAWQGRADDAAARAEFDGDFPPGYFGLTAAFAPDGRYGAWVLARPVVVVIDGTAFVHGGLTDAMAATSADAMNETLPADLAAYARAWHALLEAGVLNERVDFAERPATASAKLAELRAAGTIDAAAAPALEAAVAELTSRSDSPLLVADGPLWNRSTAWCNPNAEVVRVDAALAALGAERVALGHTPTPDSRIVSRMDGRVLLIDTGMLQPVYGGRPSALVQDGGSLGALYTDGAAAAPIEPEPRRVGQRPARLTDDEIEDLLAEGEIVAIEDVGEGVTKPQKITVRRGDVEISGLFKTESTPIDASRRSQQNKLINVSDRWEHEVAAYRLDRMIGLELVPVTVERTINGRTGSLQFWIEGLVSELDREQEKLAATGWCPLSEQWPLMFVFDALIYNEDRTKQNMTYGKDDWMMYLIDASRAFRTERGRPADIRKVELKLSPLLAERLAALDAERLNAGMRGLLERSQIQALLKRRDEILEDWQKGR
jgi:hypothetical protein